MLSSEYPSYILLLTDFTECYSYGKGIQGQLSHGRNGQVVESKDECKVKCFYKTGCKAFVYREESGKCWLKSSVEYIVEGHGKITAEMSCFKEGNNQTCDGFRVCSSFGMHSGFVPKAWKWKPFDSIRSNVCKEGVMSWLYSKW